MRSCSVVPQVKQWTFVTRQLTLEDISREKSQVNCKLTYAISLLPVTNCPRSLNCDEAIRNAGMFAVRESTVNVIGHQKKTRVMKRGESP